MTLKVLSVQIVKFWDLIKYALAQVERIGNDDDALGIYNRLFASLLSDKAQCFISYDSDENIRALCLTEIIHDEVLNIKTLHIRCLYAFKSADNATWVQDFETIKSMAIAEKCNNITFETSNPKIKSIARDIGAVEVSTNFKLEV